MKIRMLKSYCEMCQLAKLIDSNNKLCDYCAFLLKETYGEDDALHKTGK